MAVNVIGLWRAEVCLPVFIVTRLPGKKFERAACAFAAAELWNHSYQTY